MPTVKQILAEVFRRGGEDLGRVETVTALTVTSVTADALAVGTISAEKYKGKWLMRPDTATAADFARICTGFTNTSGKLDHAGANYGDTTITGEEVIISEFEPRTILEAMQRALASTRYEFRGEVPIIRKMEEVPVPAAYDWWLSPGGVDRVLKNQSPVLTLDRSFRMWGSLSAGVNVLDCWSSTGSPTLTRRVNEAILPHLRATRAGADATVYQVQSLPVNGETTEPYEGRTLTLVLLCKTSAATRIRGFITNDAGTTTYTSYHTGGGEWEELTMTYVVAAGDYQLTYGFSLETGNTACDVRDCYLADTSSITDGIRRNAFTNYQLNYGEDYVRTQWPGGWGFKGDALRAPGQLILQGSRPYPLFEDSRLRTWAAGSDSTDCPLEVAALGTLAFLYERMAQSTGKDVSRYQQLAANWKARWAEAAARNRLYTTVGRGFERPRYRPLAAPVR